MTRPTWYYFVEPMILDDRKWPHIGKSLGPNSTLCGRELNIFSLRWNMTDEQLDRGEVCGECIWTFYSLFTSEACTASSRD